MTKYILTKIFPTKSIPTNFNQKKVVFKRKNLYILLAFLLTAMVLLIAVNIYCCLIKYQTKILRC